MKCKENTTWHVTLVHCQVTEKTYDLINNPQLPSACGFYEEEQRSIYQLILK
jgi:hypothetical protein